MLRMVFEPQDLQRVRLASEPHSMWELVLSLQKAQRRCVPAPFPGAEDGGRETTEPEYPAAQSWALDDGWVTEIEYRTAVDGFVSCMRDAGYSVTDPVLSPIDGLSLLYDLDFSGDPDVWNVKVEECNLGHVSHTEPSCVEQRQQVMDPRLRSATAQCMSGRGVRLSGNEHTAKEFYEVREHTARECVGVAMAEEFPDYPSFYTVRW